MVPTHSVLRYWSVTSHCAISLAVSSISADLLYLLQPDHFPADPKLSLEVYSMSSPIIPPVMVNYPLTSFASLPDLP
jgi:hypothetical protein